MEFIELTQFKVNKLHNLCMCISVYINVYNMYVHICKLMYVHICKLMHKFIHKFKHKFAKLSYT